MSAPRRSRSPRARQRAASAKQRTGSAKPPTAPANRRSRPATGAVVAFTTAGSRDEAERLAQALVAERLAACVNLVAPISSIYHWRGAVERGEEVLLVIKTRRGLVRRLGARLGELHSYEVPELVVLPIVDGAESYLAWLMAETRATPDRRISARARRRRRRP